MPYSWSQQYWDCDGGTSEVNSPAQHNCANPEGCYQNQTCLNCLTEWGCSTNSTARCVCGADCPDVCFPDSQTGFTCNLSNSFAVETDCFSMINTNSYEYFEIFCKYNK